MELVEEVRHIAPDFAVFIGACEQFYDRPVPNTDILCRIRALTPFIHMCDDAADLPWWPQLQMYHDQSCFTVQVNIDGSYETPIAGFDEGLTLLTPTDTRAFSPRPWQEREIQFCFVGSGGGGRTEIMSQLRGRGLQYYHVDPSRSYESMAALLCNSRFVFNHPLTGTGARSHVKGRVIEAGFAGAALIEFGSSPITSWFQSNEYFTATTADDVDKIVREASGEDVAARLHERVVREHHPRIFWDRVLKKAGVKTQNGVVL